MFYFFIVMQTNEMQSGGYLSGDGPSSYEEGGSKLELQALSSQLDEVTAERNHLQKELLRMKDYLAKMNEKFSDDEVLQIQVPSLGRIRNSNPVSIFRVAVQSDTRRAVGCEGGSAAAAADQPADEKGGSCRAPGPSQPPCRCSGA